MTISHSVYEWLLPTFILCFKVQQLLYFNTFQVMSSHKTGCVSVKADLQDTHIRVSGGGSRCQPSSGQRRTCRVQQSAESQTLGPTVSWELSGILSGSHCWMCYWRLERNNVKPWRAVLYLGREETEASKYVTRSEQWTVLVVLPEHDGSKSGALEPEERLHSWLPPVGTQ